MLNNQTIDKLVQMKLPAMADSYQRLMENPDSQAMTFDELFGMAVDAEWTSRQNKRFKRLIKQAEMKMTACIEDLNYDPRRKLDKQLIIRLAEGTWIAKNNNLLITGKTGVGKSYLACAMGTMACRRNYTVKYYRLPRLLTDLNISKQEADYNRILTSLKKCTLLILDDFGLSQISHDDSRDILEVVEERMNFGATLITSQLPVSEWYNIFEDPTHADAILDRIVHNSYTIEIEGPSMREVLSRKNRAENMDD
jgi:DNA replication protein DnaC